MPSVACPLVAEFVRTVNEADAEGFAALFADEASVDDAGRVIVGRDAIARWARSDIFDVNVLFAVLDESSADGDSIVTAVVDGDFDRTGLPDPLIMMQRLTVAEGRITKLTCRLAETAPAA